MLMCGCVLAHIKNPVFNYNYSQGKASYLPRIAKSSSPSEIQSKFQQIHHSIPYAACIQQHKNV